MPSSFRFTIEAVAERESGKFASREDMADQIRTALEDANPGSLDGLGVDGESVYQVTEWEVTDA